MDSSNFKFDFPKGSSSIIKVIGVGGGGNNALKHMYEKGIHGVDFVICNTDAQALDNNPVANKIQLGITTTEGLGAGADPEVGEKAALESMEEIKAVLGQGTKMVFITAGMGGGTGTGAAPIVAKTAKEMGILTVAIVTVPFSFEGKRRLEQAESGLEKLKASVDSLIVINNDKLRQQFGDLGFKKGFAKADDLLTNAAKGMAEVITAPFTVNIDFKDAESVLKDSGIALMSTGIANGDNRAEEAVKKALDSPLLNDSKITGAKNVLLLILSGEDDAHEATMGEIGFINDYIQKESGETANIIFGVGTDAELGDSLKVLVIATGFTKDSQKKKVVSESPVRVSLSLEDDEPNQRKESPFKFRSERNKNENISFEVKENNVPEFTLSTDDKNEEAEQQIDDENKDVLHLFEQEDEKLDKKDGLLDKTEDSDEVEFKLVDRNAENDEKKEKLKEYNSFFHDLEDEISFEKISAFRRKNMNKENE